MSNSAFFAPSLSLDERWQQLLLAVLLILTVAAVTALWRNRQHRHYHPKTAWLRAIIYFCASSTIALFSGVTDAVLQRPLTTQAQLNDPLWWAGAVTCTALIVIAYGYIWAKGTFTDGRPWHPLSTTLFGLMWGLSQAQLFLSFWALIALLPIGQLWVTVFTAITISIYNGNWQHLYWDVHISPPHNYPEWNLRKVLLCHVPNLLITLPFFALYGNVQLYIALQTTALLLSAHRMHFPHWADNYQPDNHPATESQ